MSPCYSLDALLGVIVRVVAVVGVISVVRVVCVVTVVGVVAVVRVVVAFILHRACWFISRLFYEGVHDMKL